MNRCFVTTVIIFMLFTLPGSGQVKRGRNEGTFNIPASNVMGNGNIIVAAAFAGGYAASGIRIDPGMYLAVGITDIMQLSGKTAFTNFRTLGGTEGHFQLTMPGNDHLRFFGVSISGDLYLSTEMDTLSGTAVTGKPEYHAYVRPSIVIDLDWIAKFKKIPLKSYLMVGVVDNPDLLYRYSQLSLRLGTELKLNRNSYSIDLGAGLYRELRSERLNLPGDRTFSQQRFWIEPAIRYRIFDGFCLLGAVRILLLQRVKPDRPLEPTYVRLSTAFEIPLLFRETNTEAIRTMVFIEQHKVKQPNAIDVSIKEGTELKTGLNLDVQKLDLNFTDQESEKEVLKRRKEIKQKMDEIEQLLEDLE
ncbi:MAG: hypothetical protein JW913_11700 [Chitinispirillaceae bacterium]|nr:hypothetical protein [Chitinispirillaceae bacterium]